VDTKPFLKRYDGQSLAELLAMETTYRIDSLVGAIEEALSSRSDLNEAEKVVVSIEALEREVNNDGFVGFFHNSSRRYAPHVVSALYRIGCPKTAAIAQRAIDALALSGPLTVELVEAAIYREDEARNAVLEECDRDYYRGEEEPIADKLFSFIKAQRVSIRIGISH
jgi:hypothetical protein